MSPYPIDKKFESFGFNVVKIDGHNIEQIRLAFWNAKQTKGKPTCIIARTTKGKGVSFMEGKVDGMEKLLVKKNINKQWKN